MIMIDIVEVKIRPSTSRLGIVIVKYYNLVLSCDLCLYKAEKLWIRMPEIWLQNSEKKRIVWWEEKNFSDDFQNLVLKKVFDMVGLTLENAIELRKDFFAKKIK